MIGIHNFGWRLGNQLFQIASLMGMCQQNGFQPVIPDTWQYKDYFPHCSKWLGKFDSKLVVHFHAFHFVGFDNVNYDNIMIDGYLQSYKYFHDIYEYIKVLFHVKDNENKVRLPYTAIHIRRGDYLKYPDHHPVLSLDYYNKAIETIGKDKEFRIFTDDNQFCQNLINENKFATSNIEIYNGKDEMDDFATMICCTNNIIANSSFSWWSAYLNHCPNKQVISPNPNKSWFGRAYSHWQMGDLIPSDWTIV